MTEPFNAAGVSVQDRLTRLEVLHGVTETRLAEMRTAFGTMDGKLDLLLDKMRAREASLSLAAIVFRPAGVIVWATIFAGLGWAVMAFLRTVG